jgi:hypothetical protein
MAFKDHVQMEADARDRAYIHGAIEHLVEGEAGEKTGSVWEITLIGATSPDKVVELGGREFVESQNGRLYSVEALRESTPDWNGVKVYDNHLTDQEFEDRQGMRSVAKEWVGSIVKPRWDEAKKQLRGVLKVVDETLAKKLKSAHEGGVLSTIGLSIDTYPESRGIFVEGEPVVVIEGFKKIMSVDVVTEPAAGGSFNRLMASHIFRPNEKETTTMAKRAGQEFTPEFESLLETIVAEAIDKVLEQELPEEDELELEADEYEDEEELEAEEDELEPEDDLADATDAVVAAVQDAADDEEELEADELPLDDEEEELGTESLLLHGLVDVAERVDAMESEKILKTHLRESKLPASLQKLVAQQFVGRVFEEEELMGTIKRTREAFAGFDQSGKVRSNGRSRGQARNITMGLNERDIAEVEFMRLLAGSGDFRKLEHNDADFVTDRLAETAYPDWVKANRPNYGTRRLSEWVYEVLGGNPLGDQRAYEAITTSGMSSIVKNALNVMLAASYSVRHRWWEPIVRQEEVDTIDDATLVRTYGMDTLSIVNEGGAYTELPWADDEETASFVKKGNYAGITIETMLRDKLNEVRQIPDRLATSWYNTISALVSGVFTVNTATGPVLSDTGALFNATAIGSAGGHVNLLTTALSVTAYDAAYTAMAKQTDQALGAGQKLVIEPKYLLVPVDLRATALQIRNSELIPGNANNDINPYYQGFEVVQVPNWTDTDNWALVADPQQWPAIWLIFLRGRTVPELFTADSEVTGAMFTNDVLRYKVRMLTWRFSSTYECAPVSDFRPLHKSNV